jgi:colanic acid/amylovoran biosynthesis glycosyltransferase
MAGVVFTQRFGGPHEARTYRQVRRTGATVVTHEHLDPETYPYARVEVVPLKRNLADRAVGALRRLRFGHSLFLPFSCALQVGERLLERGATTIHAHRGPAGLAISLAARRLDCKLLVTLRSADAIQLPDADRSYRKALIGLFDVADRILASSRAVRERLVELGCPEDRLELLPFGVAMRPLRPRRATNRELIRAVCVAPLHPRQGVAELIDAVALARRMGAPLELDVVGDGPERANIERRVQKKAVGAVVHLRGRLTVDEVMTVLEKADLFLHGGLPHRGDDGEGPPEPLLRAMTAGLCVVATRHGGAPDAVQDGVEGLLVEDAEATHLAQVLVEVSRDAGLRVALGAAARTRVDRDFNAARSVARLKELYA